MVLDQGFRVSLCWWQTGPFSSGHSQAGLDEGKSMLLCLSVTSTPASAATLLMSPLDNDTDDREKRLTGKQRMRESSIHWIIKILLCWDHSLVSIHMKFKHLHFFSPIQRSLSKFPCHSNFLVTNTPNMFLPRSWSSSQTTGHRPWISAHLHVWSFILSTKVNNQVQCLKFCPQGRFPFTTILQGCPRNRLYYYSQPLSWAACVPCKTIYTPGFSLLFCGLILANFPRGHRCTLEKEDTVSE